MDWFQILVPTWLWWLSQGFGLIGIVLIFIALQQKLKSRQLFLQSLAILFAVISNSMILNMILVATLSINMVKNFVFAVLDVKKDKARKWEKHFYFVLFSILSVVATFIVWLFFSDTWSWFNVALPIGAVAVNYTKAYKNVHWIKWGIFGNSIIAIVNALMFANVMGVVASLIMMVSVIVFYVRSPRKKHGIVGPPKSSEQKS